MNCDCKPNTWTGVPLAVCSNFHDDGFASCSLCWHDRACHVAKPMSEEEIRKDERAKVMTEIKARLGL